MSGGLTKYEVCDNLEERLFHLFKSKHICVFNLSKGITTLFKAGFELRMFTKCDNFP